MWPAGRRQCCVSVVLAGASSLLALGGSLLSKGEALLTDSEPSLTGSHWCVDCFLQKSEPWSLEYEAGEGLPSNIWILGVIQSCSRWADFVKRYCSSEIDVAFLNQTLQKGLFALGSSLGSPDGESWESKAPTPPPPQARPSGAPSAPCPQDLPWSWDAAITLVGLCDPVCPC